MSKEVDQVADDLANALCEAAKDDYEDGLVPWEAKEQMIREQVRENVKDFVERLPRGYANLAVLVLRHRKALGDEAKDLDPCVISDDTQQVIQDPVRLQAEMEKGRLMQDIVGFTPSVMQEYFEQAVGLLEREWHEEAIDAFVFLTNLNPTVPQLWIGLGKSYEADGHLDEAFEAFRMGMMMGPDHIAPHFHFCECALQRGEEGVALETAEDLLERAKEQEPRNDAFVKECEELVAYVEGEV